MSLDSIFMRKALDLARKYEGLTFDNPSVGAVLVKDGRIISTGIHRGSGTDHAEVDAIRSAYEKGYRDLSGAILYVTLEPCSSWGKKPPCTDEIKNARISEVVIGCWDPNPANHCKSKDVLKDVNITLRIIEDVEVREEIERFYRPFSIFVQKKRPYIIVKIAQTLDGYVADYLNESKWITSDEIRKLCHVRLRFRVSGIMVGIGTAKKDDPKLLPVVDDNLKKMQKFPLYRIVLDPYLSLSLSSNLIKTSGRMFPVLVFVNKREVKSSDMLKWKESTGKDVEIIPVWGAGANLDLEEIAFELYKKGISRLLIEGGPSVWSSVFKKRMVDRLVVCISPKILGGGVKAIDFGGLRMSDIIELKHVDVEEVGCQMWVEGDVYWAD